MGRRTEALYFAAATANAFIAATILYTALAPLPLPPSGDAGDVLAYAGTFEGGVLDPRYPPVYPGIVYALTQLIGPISALKAAAVGTSFLFSLSIYALGRSMGPPLPAAVLSVILSYSAPVAEMMGWYGFPNLLGITFSCMGYAFLVRDRESPRPWSLIGFATSAALVIGTHHLSLLIFGLTLAVASILELRHGSGRLKRVALRASLTILFALPFVPTYVRYFSHYAVAGVGSSGGWMNFFHGATYVHRSLTVLFLIGLTLASIWGTWTLVQRRREDTPRLDIVVASGLSYLLAYWMFRDVQNMPFRLPYFLVPVTTIGITTALGSLSSTRHSETASGFALPVALGLAVASLAGVTFGPHLEHAIEFYSFQNEDDLEALLFVRDNLSTDVVMLPLTSGFSPDGSPGFNYGWWIQGLAERHTIMSGSPFLLTFDDQIEEAQDAARIRSDTLVVDAGSTLLGVNLNRTEQNHILFAPFGRIHAETLFMADSADTVIYADGTQRSLLDAWGKHAVIDSLGTQTVITETYTWPDTVVTRTFTVDESGHVDLRTTVRSLLKIVSLQQWLWASYGVPFDDPVNDAHRATFIQSVAGELTSGSVQAAVPQANITIYERDPRYNLPSILVQAPISGNLGELRATITYTGGTPREHELTTPCDLFEKRGVTHLYFVTGSPLTGRLPGVDVFTNPRVTIREPDCRDQSAYLLDPSLASFSLSTQETKALEELTPARKPRVLLSDEFLIASPSAGQLAAAATARRGALHVSEEPRGPLGPPEGDYASLLRAGAEVLLGEGVAVAENGSREEQQVLVYLDERDRLREVMRMEDAEIVIEVDAGDAVWTLPLDQAPATGNLAVSRDANGTTWFVREYLWDEVRVTRAVAVDPRTGDAVVRFAVTSERPVTSLEVDVLPAYGRPFLQAEATTNGTVRVQQVWHGLEFSRNITIDPFAGTQLAVTDKHPRYGYRALVATWTGESKSVNLSLRIDGGEAGVVQPLSPCDLQKKAGAAEVIYPAKSYLARRLVGETHGFWTYWDACAPATASEQSSQGASGAGSTRS